MNSLRNTFINDKAVKAYPNYWDVIALLLVFGVITALAWVARQMATPYHVGEVITLSLDPTHLPGYALHTVMRMLIAMIFSLLFTFTFATWAAKSKRAERIIIPAIDILQSVPILGFLSIAVVGFIALFPGSLLGPECAAIFVIFTSQAWNMALGFYQTVSSVPTELHEAGTVFQLSTWQRFWRIDVPFSMPGLLWNMMMSMSAGWFFVVASEAISVSNQQILLPGVGSYIALAIQAANMSAIGYAILTMFFVILIYDQLLFRPLVAWAEKFKAEQVTEERNQAESWVINVLHRTRLLRFLGAKLAHFFDVFVNLSFFRKKQEISAHRSLFRRCEWMLTWASNGVLVAVIIGALILIDRFVIHPVPLSELRHVLFIGGATALRVFSSLVVCTLIWVPLGVWIGLRPSVAHVVQPIAQFFAAFPSNLLYPLVVILIVTYHLNVNIWVTPLMILGAQWYVLFNVVAGASVIPKDLLQVADNLGLSTALRWRRLILPAIFPYYITGAITAVAGAWNASIVIEVVTWGKDTLVATGLGSYIAESTATGNFTHVALGIGVMCAFVLLMNRLVWKPLYVLSHERFRLD